MSEGVLTTGVVMRRRAVSGETAPRPAAGQARGLVFVFFLEVAPVSEGDSFTPSGEDGTRGLVPGYVPPQERTARGGLIFCFFGGALLPFVLRVVAGACVGRGTGQPRMPPQERQHEGVGFFVLADAVAVCFEGCCGSMCWPQERPATHAAAGAAARGIRGIGG